MLLKDTWFRIEKGNSVVFIDLDGLETIQIALAIGESFVFAGAVLLKCLKGECSVFGYKIRASEKKIPVWSTTSSCLLGITAINSDANHIENQVGAGADIRSEILPKYDCIVQLYQMPGDSISNFPLFKELFVAPFNSCIPDCFLVPPEEQQVNTFNELSGWDKFLSTVFCSSHSVPVIFVCGNRKVGKSTFSRWMSNQLLGVFSSVAYLSLDSGQTEFSPPGFLTLHKIGRPLLGPPFTHIIEADRSFYFGSTSVSDDPKRFLQLATCLYEWYEVNWRIYGIPLVINTMGWIKGLGAELLRHHLRSFYITHIAFLGDESEDEVTRSVSSTTTVSSFDDVRTFLAPTSTVPQVSYLTGYSVHDSCLIRPKILRDLAALSYFYGSPQVHPDYIQIHPKQLFLYSSASVRSLFELPHFMVPISAVVTEFPFHHISPGLIFQAIIMTVVGLADEDHNALGCGIVRSIGEKHLTIVSCAPFENSQRIRFVLRGNVEIPGMLLGSEKSLPYTCFSYKTGAGDLRGFRERKIRYDLKRGPSKS